MIRQSREEVTGLLKAWCEGDQAALDRLIPLIHDVLHRIAHRYMVRERRGHTLQTTALVNEAYVRLVDAGNVSWQNRVHFFAVSANLMRRILVDFARSRGYQKRGAGAVEVEFDDARVRLPQRGPDLVAVDDALNGLAVFDPRLSKVVELRFFAGLNEEEVGEALGVSSRTIKRDWALAKAWLLREMKSGEGR